MAKYFIFMYIEDRRLGACLDLAIALLNKRERWPAHVTMAGPFSEKPNIPRSLSFVQEVFLLGRGRFDTETKHTVYLNVGSKDMTAYLEKPDFPNAVPHLTLYNGRDRSLADLLFERLGSLNLYGIFYSKRLAIVESKEQYTFNLKDRIDTGILPRVRGKTLDELLRLPKVDRVELALSALQYGLHRPFNLMRALHPEHGLRKLATGAIIASNPDSTRN